MTQNVVGVIEGADPILKNSSRSAPITITSE